MVAAVQIASRRESIMPRWPIDLHAMRVKRTGRTIEAKSGIERREINDVARIIDADAAGADEHDGCRPRRLRAAESAARIIRDRSRRAAPDAFRRGVVMRWLRARRFLEIAPVFVTPI